MPQKLPLHTMNSLPRDSFAVGEAALTLVCLLPGRLRLSCPSSASCSIATNHPPIRRTMKRRSEQTRFRLPDQSCEPTATVGKPALSSNAPARLFVLLAAEASAPAVNSCRRGPACRHGRLSFCYRGLPTKDKKKRSPAKEQPGWTQQVIKHSGMDSRARATAQRGGMGPGLQVQARIPGNCWLGIWSMTFVALGLVIVCENTSR